MSDISDFVGSIPRFYDDCMGPVIFVDYADDVARRVAAFRPARVLETAAGTGIVTRCLRDRLPPESRLVATDLNAPMLEVAQAKFGAGEPVEFQTVDATALPFADGSFDAVVCQFGVMFFPDKDKSYREVHRVLAPGGRYMFSMWDSHRCNPVGRIAQEVIERFFPEDPPQFQRVPFGYAFEPARDSLIAAGFADIEAVVLRKEKQVPDAGILARGLIFGSPLFDQIRARGSVEPETVATALAEAFRDAFGAGPALIPLQATVMSATKPL
ncbi:class I SAM-dependent methyltransferase [Labrys monachus]|uniref:Ubiquinone/menaquinone biosynthesis C-methylase UbiE n=1 Tax=Labrys monachus TaxID=217067 RepID=A0ABU0FIZ6_9HYPH|nr:methyltransferase domain-containing protein [Labrys monachus]MDQ0394583.1 ubiquinone/menaquinone biosynthesis C-methylase UbiE [Labrys monachus]